MLATSKGTAGNPLPMVRTIGKLPCTSQIVNIHGVITLLCLIVVPDMLIYMNDRSLISLAHYMLYIECPIWEWCGIAAVLVRTIAILIPIGMFVHLNVQVDMTIHM